MQNDIFSNTIKYYVNLTYQTLPAKLKYSYADDHGITEQGKKKERLHCTTNLKDTIEIRERKIWEHITPRHWCAKSATKLFSTQKEKQPENESGREWKTSGEREEGTRSTSQWQEKVKRMEYLSSMGKKGNKTKRKGIK